MTPTTNKGARATRKRRVLADSKDVFKLSPAEMDELRAEEVPRASRKVLGFGSLGFIGLRGF